MVVFVGVGVAGQIQAVLLYVIFDIIASTPIKVPNVIQSFITSTPTPPIVMYLPTPQQST